MRSPDGGTIASAIEACRQLLRPHSPTPALDARVLATHVTGLDASALIAYGDSRLDEHRRLELWQLAERRAHGEPIAHIIGSKEFFGLRIMSSADALVPRPETEELVQAVAADWRGRAASIIDVGTGSGAIACALATQLPDARITATDSSDRALDLARRNVEQHGLRERVRLLAGDLFAAVEPQARFDAIVANLPYVRQADADLDPRVRAYEPHEALFAGADGLEIYRRFFAQAPAHLLPGGGIYCECGPATAAGMRAMGTAAFPGAVVELRDDLAGLARVVVVRP